MGIARLLLLPALALVLGGCATPASDVPVPHAATARFAGPIPLAHPLPARATELAAPSAEPAIAKADDDVVVLQGGGDVTYPFGYTSDRAFLAEGAGLFSDLAPLIAGADLTFANLEGPFSDHYPPDPEAGILVTPIARLRWVVDAGFNLFSLANNHSQNGGDGALLDPIAGVRALASPARPLWTAGVAETPEHTGEPTWIDVPGRRTRLAVFAFAPAHFHLVDWSGSPSARERIAAAARVADAVVVSVHGGREYAHVPDADITALYRGFIDAGARVVLGHHPHVAQGIERYRDGVIFYSLGNLSFGTHTRAVHTGGAFMYGLFARVVLRAGKLDDARAYPLFTGNFEALVASGASLAPHFCHPQLLREPFLSEAAERLRAWSAAIPGVTPTELALEEGALVARVPTAEN